MLSVSITNVFLLEGSLRNPIAPPLKSSKQPHQPFVIFSPPKCGTHLVGKALSLLVNENPAYYLTGIGDGTTLNSLNLIASEEAKGCFVVAHHFNNTLLRTLVSKGHKIIFVVRDPRDQLISAINWINEGQWSWLPIAKMTNFNEQITEAITGSLYGWQSVESCYLTFERELAGLPPESYHRVYYEKLVGASGKGSLVEQNNELIAIANFISLPINNTIMTHTTDHLFGGTKTFRDGSIGKWRLMFSDHQKELFKQRYNSLLIRLGYEYDSKW